MISKYFWTFTKKVSNGDYTSGAGECNAMVYDDVADHVANHYKLEPGDKIVVNDGNSKHSYVVKLKVYAEKI